MVCVYDNPAHMMRECWQDGVLIYACDYQYVTEGGSFERGDRLPSKLFFFGANIGLWDAGQIVGDPRAMENGDAQNG